MLGDKSSDADPGARISSGEPAAPQEPSETRAELTDTGPLRSKERNHLTARVPLAAGRIVGIGASAGGLESLEQLFDALPPDTGMAFIIVQHLSPDFRSLMDE